MSDSGRREWFFYLDDMIEFAGKVLSYTNGLSQAEFIKSGISYDAVLRNLELIGEAASHIPEEIRTANPDIPWRMIIATRNRLIHGYLGIDNDIIWSIIRKMYLTSYRRCNRLKTRQGHKVFYCSQVEFI